MPPTYATLRCYLIGDDISQHPSNELDDVITLFSIAKFHPMIRDKFSDSTIAMMLSPHISEVIVHH